MRNPGAVKGVEKERERERGGEEGKRERERERVLLKRRVERGGRRERKGRKGCERVRELWNEGALLESRVGGMSFPKV